MTRFYFENILNKVDKCIDSGLFGTVVCIADFWERVEDIEFGDKLTVCRYLRDYGNLVCSLAQAHQDALLNFGEERLKLEILAEKIVEVAGGHLTRQFIF